MHTPWGTLWPPMGGQETGDQLLDVGGTELQPSFAAIALREMLDMKCFRGCLGRIEGRGEVFGRRAHGLHPFWRIIVLGVRFCCLKVSQVLT
jgi:hypothetical protein